MVAGDEHDLSGEVPRRPARRTAATARSRRRSGTSRSSIASPSRTSRSTSAVASSRRSMIGPAAQQVGPGAGAEVEVGDEGGLVIGGHRRTLAASRRPRVDSAADGEPDGKRSGGREHERSRDRRRESGDRRDARHVPETSAEEVRDLVAAARRAQPAWAEAGFEDRGRILMAARAWMVANGERVVDDDLRRDRPARRRDPVRRALLRDHRARVLGQAAPRATSPTRTSRRPRRSSAAAAGSRSATRRSASSA